MARDTFSSNRKKYLSWQLYNKTCWSIFVVLASSWCSFSSPEPRSFWPAAWFESSGFARQRKSAIHGLPVKSGKSDSLRIWDEYSAHAQKLGSGQSSRSLPQVRRIVALGTTMLDVEDTGYVTDEHRITNLLFWLLFFFFCHFVLYCFPSTFSSTPKKSPLFKAIIVVSYSKWLYWPIKRKGLRKWCWNCYQQRKV